MKTFFLLPAIFVTIAAAVCAAEPDAGVTVHEWGTFTSVQGADGVQMPWNPLVAPELPKFVYDRHPPELGGTFKLSFTTRQRMETPVLYFYSDRARSVDVAVRFPEGIVTEWYPDKSAVPPSPVRVNSIAAAKEVSSSTPPANLPPADALAGQLPGKTVLAPMALHWKKVEILPPSAGAAALPLENAGSHYYAARETDASLLRTTTGGKTETEKFLFYRGVASFSTPLIVRPMGDDAAHVALTNSGAEELRNLFLYEVRVDGRLAWIAVPKLAPGESQTVALSQAEMGGDKLLDLLRSALVHEGLYEKEAAAMVKTWESAWFGERGLRALYTLPRAWTDRTLPLAVTPPPKSIERVMVARAEIITPQMEIALREKMDRYVAARPEERPRIVEETRALGLGRFLEAASSRARVGQHPQEYYQLSRELIQAARSAPKSAAQL